MATGQGPTGRMHGYRVCADCGVVVAPLRLCLAPTKNGAPCRVGVRDDLGFERSWSHGEGAGHTNRPRKRGAA
jgi:hypothetical protein